MNRATTERLAGLCDKIVFVGICILLLAVPLAISGKTTEGTLLVKAVVAQGGILIVAAFFVLANSLQGRLMPRMSSLTIPLALMLATSALSLPAWRHPTRPSFIQSARGTSG